MVEHALLSVDEMYRADALAVAVGVASLTLMENAGQAIVRAVEDRWAPRPVAILCGPGNNGGDGFVAARLLATKGWTVRLALLGEAANLKGDAKANAGRWTGRTETLSPDILAGAELVIDALFGAGLTRPLEGAAAAVIKAIDVPVVGVDVPSGVHGDSGQILGTAPQAALTVTFCRAKPGHWLLPGRERCGELVVADIGIPDAAIDDMAPQTVLNAPGNWRGDFPVPTMDSHKYRRGHALIAGGAEMTGAARLAAQAVRRVGAGLVSIATPKAAFSIYAASDPGNLVSTADFTELLADRRRNAVLIGPGAGVGADTRNKVLTALKAGKSTVVDADGLTSFEGAPNTLFAGLNADCVLTPHDGEFSRLFDSGGDKLTRTRQAAAAGGAVVLLKGADTVIAAPDGRAAINSTGTPYLATGGSGDVLAGMITGLLAQGMPAFEAACAAAWMQGRCADRFGPGLIAEDLPGLIPEVLGEIVDFSV